MAGVRFVLETLCDPAPVVVPVPSYPPLLHVVPLTGREVVTVPALDGSRRLNVDAIEAAFAAGARTILLSSPHNPLGRAWSRAELEALRDAALRHGARVISDEIHAPLVLPGATHVPYASIEGTAEHGTTVTSASKAFNMPGLKCAQIVTGTPADAATLTGIHFVANHGVSPLGLVATRAAYAEGGQWLDGVVAALGDRRAELAKLLAERLPEVAWTPPEATYLAWLDLSGTGLADPVQRAAHGRRRDALPRSRLRPRERAVHQARVRHVGGAPGADRRRPGPRLGDGGLARSAQTGPGTVHRGCGVAEWTSCPVC